MARGDQLARQWRILQSLIAARRGKSAADLAQQLDYHWRTVYRDLEALQLAGFPIFTDRVEGKNRWSILDSARQHIPIPLDLAEVMALYFSRGLMRVLKDTVFYASLESFFQKIKATLPAETIQYLEKIEQSFEIGSKPYKRYDQLRDVVDRISQATVDRQIIEIDYYTMSRKKKTRRKVAPYKIWFFDGAFYLVGYCGLRKDIRIFALDRIKALQKTDESFEMPEDFKVENLMQTSFGVFHDKTQKIKSQNDGSVIFEARVAGTDEIKYWLMSWGGKAEVLRPQSLRDEILAEAKAMQHTYQR